MATADHQFKAAPFDGSGIIDPSMAVYDMQFKEPHNGIVYTPPRYSDHVGVSFVFNALVLGNRDEQGVLFTAKRTSKSQPHKSIRKISSFFGKKAEVSSSGGGLSLSGPKKTGLKLSNKKQRTLTSFLNKS